MIILVGWTKPDINVAPPIVVPLRRASSTSIFKSKIFSCVWIPDNFALAELSRRRSHCVRIVIRTCSSSYVTTAAIIRDCWAGWSVVWVYMTSK